jgi:hypothetical protein
MDESEKGLRREKREELKSRNAEGKESGAIIEI